MSRKLILVGSRRFIGAIRVKIKKNLFFQQYHIYEPRHTKGEPWNSIIKASGPTYRQVPKTTLSAPLLIQSENKKNSYSFRVFRRFYSGLFNACKANIVGLKDKYFNVKLFLKNYYCYLKERLKHMRFGSTQENKCEEGTEASIQYSRTLINFHQNLPRLFENKTRMLSFIKAKLKAR